MASDAERAAPADERLGVDGFLTRQARRLVTLAGFDHSFARAQQVLAEFCGWEVDDEVIRQTTHAEARRVADQRPERNDAAPLLDLATYAAKHPTRLGYADRLASGRSIGSGAVEGGIKPLLNLRMKRTGARGRVELRAINHT